MSVQAPYRIIHRVLCNGSDVQNEDHSEHPERADFENVPRLWKGQTRGHPLRGLSVISRGDSLGDPEDDHSVLIVREYSCQSYHKSIKGLFEAANPGLRSNVTPQARPWLFILPENGPEATCDTEYIVISEELIDCLENYSEDPTAGLWNAATDLRTPYDYFYYYREPLGCDYAPKLPADEAEDLRILLLYIEESHGAQFERIRESLESGRVSKDMLSKLYPPNTVVVAKEDGNHRAYIAERATMIGKSAVELQCWTLTFDGSFRETIAIDSLIVWPLQYDKSNLRQQLIERGKTFWTCRHRRLVNYQAPSPGVFELHVTNPKYMIDYKTYRQLHGSKEETSLASDSEMQKLGLDMSSDEPPGDVTCILMPSTLVGYAFHDKKWRTLATKYVGKVRWKPEAFKLLVLEEKTKETIKALVTVHLAAPQDIDIVENKGNGLIMLLHGSPGTGKTLTAESVAELCEKPLYRVTCGDVGTTPENVEKYLQTVLLIGSIWNCIVLLDEADVFLEERQPSDLNRNALVSVFLRVLEYYPGILFLTTNRVGTFDEAFKSRVHLAAHYPALEADDREKLWHNFLGALKDKGVSLEYNTLARQIYRFAKLPFNGRQIRNSLWTASQVARYKNEPLSYEHVDQVVSMATKFEEHIRITHGGWSDEDRAKSARLRA